jgi:hypothetical protein
MLFLVFVEKYSKKNKISKKIACKIVWERVGSDILAVVMQ